MCCLVVARCGTSSTRCEFQNAPDGILGVLLSSDKFRSALLADQLRENKVMFSTAGKTTRAYVSEDGQKNITTSQLDSGTALLIELIKSEPQCVAGMGSRVLHNVY